MLGFSGRALGSPLIVSRAAVWIDPTAPTMFLAAASDAFGYCEVRLPIPADKALIGLRLFDQFFWADSCAPGGLSASNALAITPY
jgi:hypothetical protein